MGHSNIYIRKENELVWDSIADKSAWVNARLGNIKSYPITKENGATIVVDYETKLSATQPDRKPCKHGADPKLCRYAKSGKGCR